MLKTRTIITCSLFLIIVAIPSVTSQNIQNSPEESGYVVDSEIDFDTAVSGKNIPPSVIQNLRIVDVYYYGFDNKLHKGQLIVHKEVVLDIIEIFEFIRESQFPVNKVIPISNYGWSDEKSMMDNNTSAFNYRFISGTRVISNHASGLAIDINPLLNPYIKNGNSLPANCVYDTTKAGTLFTDSQLVAEFKLKGWQWGGEWKSLKDYQHFEKKLK